MIPHGTGRWVGYDGTGLDGVSGVGGAVQEGRDVTGCGGAGCGVEWDGRRCGGVVWCAMVSYVVV